MKSIRSKTLSFAFGHPRPLPTNKLPLEVDVYNFFRLESTDVRKCKQRNTTQRKIAKNVGDAVKHLWLKASLPVKSDQMIVRQVLDVVGRARKINKAPATKRSAKIEKPLQRLFDICACKCKVRSQCSCLKERKVPTMEWDFLRDQRGKRLQSIGSIDTKTSRTRARMQMRAARPAASPEPGPSGAAGVDPEAGLFDTLDVTSDDSSTEECPSADWVDEELSEDEEAAGEDLPCASSDDDGAATPTQNKLHIVNFARECDRYGVSDRAAAALATGLLVDLDLVTDDSNENVVTRDKVRRARDKWRAGMQEKLQHDTQGKLQCIGFDGRQDRTNIIEEIEDGGNTVRVRKLGKEKHLVCVAQPGGQYLAHRALQMENSESVAAAVLDVARETQSQASLVAVLLDGTNVNTGRVNGAVARMERQLGRSLQWLVCLLHSNELPLR